MFLSIDRRQTLRSDSVIAFFDAPSILSTESGRAWIASFQNSNRFISVTEKEIRCFVLVSEAGEEKIYALSTNSDSLLQQWERRNTFRH